jgi:hypothetical protein
MMWHMGRKPNYAAHAWVNLVRRTEESKMKSARNVTFVGEVFEKKKPLLYQDGRYTLIVLSLKPDGSVLPTMLPGGSAANLSDAADVADQVCTFFNGHGLHRISLHVNAETKQVTASTAPGTAANVPGDMQESLRYVKAACDRVVSVLAMRPSHRGHPRGVETQVWSILPAGTLS